MKLCSSALVLGLAVVLVLAATALPASQPSRPLPADAGQVSAFSFGAGGALYVGTIPGYNQGRVYTATAGGQWRLISGRGWTWLGALAADPRRPGTLYAGTGNEVYKTTDGGRTWRSSNKGLLPPPGTNKGEGWVEWLGLVPRSSTLYDIDFATSFRKSLDGGLSWGVVASTPNTFGHFGQPQIAWTSPPTLYAWSIKEVTGPQHKLTFSLGLHRFREGGRSWHGTRLRVAIAARGAEPPRLSIDPRHPTTLYAAVNDRIFTSADAGEHWKNIAHGLPQGQKVTSLAIGSGTLYAAVGANGIWETTDEGTTWRQSWPRSGQAPGLGVGLLAVDPKRPSTVLAAAYYPEKRSTGTHVLRSTDGGRTWAVVG